MSECAAAELVELCNVTALATAIGGGADYTPVTDALEEVETGIVAQTAALQVSISAVGDSVEQNLDALNTIHGDLTLSLSNSTSVAYEASRVIKASAGKLYGLIGYNSKASAQFIQLFNSATVPADTAVPVVVITVAASSNFSIDFGQYGRSFSAGIAVSNSSTGPTKTVGSADIWVDAQYS